MKFFIRVVIAKTVLDAVVFVFMIASVMTDEKTPEIAKVFYFILKYILGFPLFFLDEKFPFFLEAKDLTISFPLFIILNNIHFALIILGARKLIRK